MHKRNKPANLGKQQTLLKWCPAGGRPVYIVTLRQIFLSFTWSQGITPCNRCVVLAHITQIRHELPNVWVHDLHFINVYSHQSESCPAKQVGHVMTLYFAFGKTENEAHGPMNVYGILTCHGRNVWRDPAFSVNLGNLKGRSMRSQEMTRSTSNIGPHLSSKSVSPPSIAPRKTPSGLKHSFIWTNTPLYDISLQNQITEVSYPANH